jgi:Fe-S cluster assembly iron-binding protein IscA
MDRMSALYLTEATVDFADTLEASGFTIDNPMAAGTCANGHAFR